jgi:hypothetical protein
MCHKRRRGPVLVLVDHETHLLGCGPAGSSQTVSQRGSAMVRLKRPIVIYRVSVNRDYGDSLPAIGQVIAAGVLHGMQPKYSLSVVIPVIILARLYFWTRSGNRKGGLDGGLGGMIVAVIRARPKRCARSFRPTLGSATRKLLRSCTNTCSVQE